MTDADGNIFHKNFPMSPEYDYLKYMKDNYDPIVFEYTDGKGRKNIKKILNFTRLKYFPYLILLTVFIYYNRLFGLKLLENLNRIVFGRYG